MSQSEIIKLLEKNKEMSCMEIAKELKISFWATSKALIAMLRSGEIERSNKSKEQVIQEGKHYTGRALTWKLKND